MRTLTLARLRQLYRRMRTIWLRSPYLIYIYELLDSYGVHYGRGTLAGDDEYHHNKIVVHNLYYEDDDNFGIYEFAFQPLPGKRLWLSRPAIHNMSQELEL